MKYRVIIIDDEVKIIQLITQLVHWQELDMEIVAVCNDGDEALQCIAALRPDIVLTDIKMPVVDGISMIEKVQEMEIHTNFIVISGYKHFEYARNAIQLGVVDYLLKPLDERQLNRVLDKTCRKVDEERRQVEKLEKLEEYQNLEKQKSIKKFWEILLQNGTDKSDFFKSSQQCNETFQTTFSSEFYRCIDLSTNMDSLLGGAASLFEEKMVESCGHIFGAICTHLVVTGVDGTYLVLNYEKQQQDAVRRGISALYYSIKNLEEIYGNFQINIGVGGEVSVPAMLGESMRQAKAAWWGRLVLLGDRIIDYALIEDRQHFTIRDILTAEEELELNNAIRAFQFGEIGGIFKKMTERAQRYLNGYPGNMQEVMEYLFGKFALARKECSMAEQRRLLLVMRNSRNFPIMMKEFYLCFSEQLHSQYDEIKSRMGRPIEETKTYLKEHYGEQISMEEMAGRNNLSVSYFCKLFKMEMHMGFMEYLTKIRMDEARRLLVETNDAIKVIATRVGYFDDKYFSKTFKKQLGISPKEYRKLYS